MAITINGTAGITYPDGILQAQAATLTGSVGFFAMNSAPSGWVKANGAAVSRTTYAALFATIGTTFGVGDGSTTFNVPDMRGYFARGWVDNGSVDSGRAFGSTQTDSFASHTHYFNGAINAGLGGYRTPSSANPSGGPEYTTATGGTETRPVNVAFLACIKY